MRFLLSATLLSATISLSSCSLYFDAYVRNLTNEIAIIDVYLVNTHQWTKLPNRVKVAPKLRNFKGGYKKYFTEISYATWIDSQHLQLQLSPGSAIDLSDMAGQFINGSPINDVTVIISSFDRPDTIIDDNGITALKSFKYKNKLFRPIVFYDVE